MKKYFKYRNFEIAAKSTTFFQTLRSQRFWRKSVISNEERPFAAKSTTFFETLISQHLLAHKLKSQRFWRTAAKSTTKKMQATSLQFLLHSKTALFFGKKNGSKIILHWSLRASYEAERYFFPEHVP